MGCVAWMYLHTCPVYLSPLILLPVLPLAMVWCSCPSRCKGGRKVSQSTYNRHKNEMRAQEEQQLADEICHAIPNISILQPDVFEDTGRHHANSGAQGAPRKKAWMGNRQDNSGAPLVRVLVDSSQLRLTFQQAVCSR